MSETRTPLTGDAAREALKEIIESTKYAVGYSPEMTAALLATGQIAVYAPEDPACVAQVDAALNFSHELAQEVGRALHAADRCSCHADALLRRSGSVRGERWTAWHEDIRAYLAERAR